MTRLRALTEAGLLHPNPDAVLAPLFTGGSGFFLASDKVQVKYEMLRARLVEGVPVSEAAACGCASGRPAGRPPEQLRRQPRQHRGPGRRADMGAASAP